MWRFYGRIVRGSEISFVISSGDIGVDSRRKPTIAAAQESFSLLFSALRVARAGRNAEIGTLIDAKPVEKVERDIAMQPKEGRAF